MNAWECHELARKLPQVDEDVFRWIGRHLAFIPSRDCGLHHYLDASRWKCEGQPWARLLLQRWLTDKEVYVYYLLKKPDLFDGEIECQKDRIRLFGAAFKRSRATYYRTVKRLRKKERARPRR